MYGICERIGPGLLAEPFNALTSTGFLVVAWAGWSLARRTGNRSAGIRGLLALSVAIGLGSGLWHTLATSWAFILDVVPISLFVVVWTWLYARSFLGMRAFLAAAAAVVFLSTAYAVLEVAGVLHVSLTYTPMLVVWFGLVVLGVVHARGRVSARFSLLAAAAVCALALLFRLIDLAVCPTFPVGTHFLWHSFGALTAFLVIRCLMLAPFGPDPEERTRASTDREVPLRTCTEDHLNQAPCTTGRRPRPDRAREGTRL